MLEGLPPNNATPMMRLTIDEARARAVADLVVESFEPAEAASTAFETETRWPGGGRAWQVEVYFGFEPDPDDLRALVSAGLAFGTGHHGTTRGCLLHFDRLLKRRRPRKVLDVGCGAGVLAIAAAKALRRTVWLGDIDPIAVEVAHANARLNGVAAYVKPLVSRGVENRALGEGGPFDLVFANILAKPPGLL